jgi:hypothetical protein
VIGKGLLGWPEVTSRLWKLTCNFGLWSQTSRAENGLARSVAVDERQPMRANLLMTSLRVLTWCCVTLLALLSLLPAERMVRTGLPGRLEHFVA